MLASYLPQLFLILKRIEPIPPPSNIHLIDVAQTHLIFHWNQLTSDLQWAGSGSCSSFVYNIIASNCGSCPNSTSSSFTTCINMTINGSTCLFAVETKVCGNIVGHTNNTISVFLDGRYHYLPSL